MRNKKSKLIYYIIAAVFAAAVGCVILLEVPLKQEHIEQVIK